VAVDVHRDHHVGAHRAGGAHGHEAAHAAVDPMAARRLMPGWVPVG